MRKISDSKLQELLRGGVKVFADGRRVLHRMQRNEQEGQDENSTSQSSDPGQIDTIIEMLRIQNETQSIMAQYGEMVAACVTELSKPKPLKKWACSVGRGSNGQINNIDITER